MKALVALAAGVTTIHAIRLCAQPPAPIDPDSSKSVTYLNAHGCTAYFDAKGWISSYDCDKDSVATHRFFAATDREIETRERMVTEEGVLHLLNKDLEALQALGGANATSADTRANYAETLRLHAAAQKTYDSLDAEHAIAAEDFQHEIAVRRYHEIHPSAPSDP